MKFLFVFFLFFATLTVANLDVVQIAPLTSKTSWDAAPNAFRYRLQYQRVGTTNWAYAYVQNKNNEPYFTHTRVFDTLGTYRVGIRYQNCLLCGYSPLQLDSVSITY